MRGLKLGASLAMAFALSLIWAAVALADGGGASFPV